jgi:hypothetical protein
MELGPVAVICPFCIDEMTFFCGAKKNLFDVPAATTALNLAFWFRYGLVMRDICDLRVYRGVMESG